MENHYFYWVNPLFLWPCSIAMLVYQTVYPHDILMIHQCLLVFPFFSQEIVAFQCWNPLTICHTPPAVPARGIPQPHCLRHPKMAQICHGIHGNMMSFMDFVLISMDFHVFLWISVNVHGFCMDFNGFSWFLMDFNGFLWIFIWISMDFHCF